MLKTALQYSSYERPQQGGEERECGILITAFFDHFFCLGETQLSPPAVPRARESFKATVGARHELGPNTGIDSKKREKPCS